MSSKFSSLLCLFSQHKMPLCVKKKGCVFALTKGFRPRTMSASGTTGESWALAPYVHSAAVPSSLSGSAPPRQAFAENSYSPGSLFSNTTAGFERAWSDATRQRDLCSSFLRVRGEIFSRNSHRNGGSSALAAKFCRVCPGDLLQSRSNASCFHSTQHGGD